MKDTDRPVRFFSESNQSFIPSETVWSSFTRFSDSFGIENPCKYWLFTPFDILGYCTISTRRFYVNCQCFSVFSTLETIHPKNAERTARLRRFYAARTVRPFELKHPLIVRETIRLNWPSVFTENSGDIANKGSVPSMQPLSKFRRNSQPDSVFVAENVLAKLRR